MRRRSFLQQTVAGGSLLTLSGTGHGVPPTAKNSSNRIQGSLRLHPTNGRYFTDDSGRAIYLVGSHLGWELQDDAWDKQITFDYESYLDLLTQHGHNVVRMWCVEHTRTDKSTADVVAAPMPFARTGPGRALDGQPKFNLERFDQAYFKRLRDRTAAAATRGIYVMVMLFQGWSHRVQKKTGKNPWFGSVYNKSNNVNGIDGDRGQDGHGAASHTLGDATLLAIQEAYVQKVIDTVGDLDNVLYEISNESLGTIDWHEHMVRLIHRYEQKTGKRHPVVVSGCGDGLSNEQLLSCSAEMVGLSGIGDRKYLNNPPAADGAKVVLHDTDHIKPTCSDPAFVWKNFLRGNHPIVLDWDLTDRRDEKWTPIRRAMGYSRQLADRINLAAMTPAGSLASSGYCLAHRGSEYLVYVPNNSEVKIDLGNAPGRFSVEWINVRNGKTTQRQARRGGSVVTLTAPSKGILLVYLKAEA